MLSVYQQTFQVLRANVLMLLLIAVLFEAIDAVTEYLDSSAFVALIPQLLVILQLHLSIMTGTKLFEPAKVKERPPFGHFFAASVVILLVAATGAIGVSTWSGLPTDSAIGLFVIAFLGFYLVLLTFLGTSLPAAAVRDGYNPLISLRRAGKTWIDIAGGLLLCSLPLGGGLFVALLIGASQIGIQVNDYVDFSAITILGLIFGILLHFVGLIGTLSAVVVLCRAYKKIAPTEILEKLDENFEMPTHIPA